MRCSEAPVRKHYYPALLVQVNTQWEIALVYNVLFHLYRISALTLPVRMTVRNYTLYYFTNLVQFLQNTKICPRKVCNRFQDFLHYASNRTEFDMDHKIYHHHHIQPSRYILTQQGICTKQFIEIPWTERKQIRQKVTLFVTLFCIQEAPHLS